MKQQLSFEFAAQYPEHYQSLPVMKLQIRLQLCLHQDAPAAWQGSAFHLLTLNIRGTALHHVE